MSSLASAIDYVLAFGDGSGWQIPKDERQVFVDLCERVYDLAHAAGLEAHLPRADRLSPRVTVPELRPATFEGALDLPGDWIDGHLCGVPEGGWRAQMLRLRRYAAAQVTPKPAASPAKTSSRKTSLDARAVALFLEDRTRTKSDLARILGVRTQSLSPSRCPQLHLAMAAWKAASASAIPKGSKSRDGDLEARSDDE